MFKKVAAGLLAFVLAWILAGCGRIETPPAEPWQDAYAEFLRTPEKYAEEEPHRAENFMLADMDNDGQPELIIAYYDGLQGGAIFANIYSYDGNVSTVGRQIDMYYKTIYLSSDPSFPGVFVEGGRNSTFSCNYWTIKNNVFVEEPLWSDAYQFDIDEIVYEEFTGNKQLIAEAKKVISLYPYGMEFFEMDEVNIQIALYGGGALRG